MKRLFLAIKITPNEKFNDLYQNLHTNLFSDKIRWVDPKNLHLTLKFFGETKEDQINGINLLIENIVSHIHPFNFEISNLGIFGSSYLPKVIWLGINNSKPLINLADTILNELETIGFERDRQNFVPHLTLGRIKSIKDKERFKQILSKYNNSDIQTVNVNEIFLFESILRKEGPYYNLISGYKLKL